MELEKQNMEDDLPGANGEERKSLMSGRESPSDGEVYSCRRCLKAPSFKFAMLVSLIAVILLLLLIMTLTISLVLTSSHGRRQEDTITLDDVFDSRFQTKTYSGEWIPSSPGLFMEFSRDGGVVFVNYGNNNERTTIISPEVLKSLEETHGNISSVKPSPASTPTSASFLLVTNWEKVYRHSSLANYLIYSNGSTSNLTESGMKLHYAEWSPDGGKIAYVMDYNVYVYDVSTGNHTQITEGGTKDGERYGIPDWVYEEEVFSTDHALWWSHDSQYLLYASFDDTLVKRFSFPIYGSPDNQYTTIESIPYPKPGTINPTVALHVVTVGNTELNWTLSAGSLSEFDHYVVYTGLVGTSSEHYAYVAWVNRTQTYIDYCLYDFQQEAAGSEVECISMYSQELPGTWIELQSDPRGIYVDLTSDPKRFLTLLNTDGVGYTHLAWVTSEGDVDFITSGDYEVTDIVNVAYNGNEIESVVYLATTSAPSDRHIHHHDFTDNQSKCLSCDQEDWDVPDSPNPSLPKECSYFSASCDHRNFHCVFNCRGPAVPFSLIYHIPQSSPILIPETNEVLREAIANKTLPTYQFFEIPADGDAPSLKGRMLRPPGFDENKKYPVLVYVYGGPNSQVVNSIPVLYSLSHLYYVSHLNIIVASVDGRGTGYRGGSFKYSVFENLGHFETIDQNRAGRYLQGLNYVAGDHLAIYGSSYGGYMAAMVGSSGEGVFSTAISQSPVSDWHYYDSIYTERYMNKPNDNTEGYEVSSVLKRAGKLSDVNYLLIHGTGDDNVHFQHSTQLVEALTEADVHFELMIYTDKDHSLRGGNTQRHLVELITNFLHSSFHG